MPNAWGGMKSWAWNDVLFSYHAQRNPSSTSSKWHKAEQVPILTLSWLELDSLSPTRQQIPYSCSLRIILSPYLSLFLLHQTLHYIYSKTPHFSQLHAQEVNSPTPCLQPDRLKLPPPNFWFWDPICQTSRPKVLQMSMTQAPLQPLQAPEGLCDTVLSCVFKFSTASQPCHLKKLPPTLLQFIPLTFKSSYLHVRIPPSILI